MNVRAYGRSDIGKVRGRNEDAFVVRSDIGVYAVADGMGGHVAGDVASKTALSAFVAAIDSGIVDEDSIRSAIMAANHAVWQRGETERDKAGMGTTLTTLAVAPTDAELLAGHVGDSRLYRLRAGVLDQLTRDHTAAQELVDAGQLTRHMARRHPLSSMLYRAIGTSPELEVDVYTLPVEPGDRYLLCSEGLSGMIDDPDLAAILAQDKSLESICADLIDTANAHGGVDNITTILVHVE